MCNCKADNPPYKNTCNCKLPEPKWEVGKKYRLRNDSNYILTVLYVSPRGNAVVQYNEPKTYGGQEYLKPKDDRGMWEEYKEPRKGKSWVNINKSDYGGSYPSREEADRWAAKGRIACVEVDWEGGQGL